MTLPSIHDLAQIADPQARAQAIGRLLAEHQAALMDLARLRREAVAELRSAGLTQAQVAQVLGVTPGRVAQLEPEAAEDRERPGQPPVLVERGIPTDPAVRASRSLFLSETVDQGVVATRKMLDVGQEPAHAYIAARLGIAEGEPVLVRRRLMSANDVPLRISVSYFPISLAEGLTDPDFVEGGLQVLFEGRGLRFGRALETLAARMPTPDEARTLQLEAGVPVVHILRSSYDTDDNPVHTLESICAANRHVFPIRQPEGDTVF